MSRNRSSPRSRITEAEAKDALLRSGYLIESRIEAILRRRKYYVAANAAYRDSETGRARELDVYGMNAEKAGPSQFDWLFLVLFVECVNNPQPLAFLTKMPLVSWMQRDAIKVSGLPVKFPVIPKSRDWRPLVDHLSMERYHHYCKGPIATQFCSFARKKGAPPGEGWFALHEDAHFDAFRKLCDATEDSMRRHFEGWRFEGHEPVNIEICYPVLVVQGELLAVRPGKRSITLKRVNHVQYYRTTILGQRELEYQIDVVTERFFPRYLKIAETEVSRTARLLRRRHKEVRQAIERIVPLARNARSPEKRRATMEQAWSR